MSPGSPRLIETETIGPEPLVPPAFFRGFLYGLLLAVPAWALIALAAWTILGGIQ
jgi:hypothetical protein